MTFLCFLQEREEVRMRLSWNEGVKKGNRRDEAKKSQECCWGGEALADWLTPSTAKLSAPGKGGEDPAGGGCAYACWLMGQLCLFGTLVET